MILAMNIAQISLFVICVEVIIYLLLENLHDCTFKECHGTDTFDSYFNSP